MLYDRKKILNMFKRLENAKSKENETLQKICIKFLEKKIEFVSTNGNMIVYDRLDFYHDFTIGTKFCIDLQTIIDYLKKNKEKNIDFNINYKDAQIVFDDVLFIDLQSASSYPNYEQIFDGYNENLSLKNIRPFNANETLKIGISKEYLIKILENMDANKYTNAIYFEINKNDALSPIKIAPYNDNENVNILMPIMLRG